MSHSRNPSKTELPSRQKEPAVDAQQKMDNKAKPEKPIGKAEAKTPHQGQRRTSHNTPHVMHSVWPSREMARSP